MSVVITSPAPNEVLSGTETVTATFTGTGFDVATVTLNGVQLASDSSLPLSFQVDTTRVADGDYTLIVAVRHKKGSGNSKMWTKAQIPVTVDNTIEPPPTSPVFTTNIVDGQTISLPFAWTVSVDPAPDSVQFWADGNMLELDEEAPFVHELTLAPGTHDLGICAWHGSVRTCYSPLGGGKFATITIEGPPPPPPTGYTYRFAGFNTSTDKITGCLNRFPPTYSWWVPGSAEGSPWPKGGGIKPVSHPTYGPGLDLVVTDEMLYGNPTAGPKDSNVVRFVAEPHLVDERLRVPAPGSIHTWECTIMRPPGTWPNGFYECVWEQGTDNGYGANVGHHIFLNNNGRFPGWSYYFGRQTGSGPLGGTYWQFYNAPVPFNAGEYHTIRWEFKWTAPGVANGYLKTWIGVNGAPLAPWLDLQNIATHVAGFKQHYTQMVTIRTPRNVLSHPNLSLHVYDMRVKIA